MNKALVICSSHVESDADFSYISGIEKDAEYLCDLFQKHFDDTPNFRVEKQISKDAKYLTKDDVDKALKFMLENGKHVELAIIYFIGHGFVDTDGVLRYATSNSKCSGADSIRIDDVLKKAYESEIVDVVIILDCCYSGNLIFENINIQNNRKVHILTASRDNEVILKDVASGSYFTRIFCEGMEGAAANQMSSVTLSSMFDFLSFKSKTNFATPCLKTITNRNFVIRNCRSRESLDSFKITVNDKEYLDLLKHVILKSKNQVYFTSTRMADSSHPKIGEQQMGIIDASKKFYSNNSSRQHYGIIDDNRLTSFGACELVHNVDDIILKFDSDFADDQGFNFLVSDSENVVLRLKSLDRANSEEKITFFIKNTFYLNFLFNIILFPSTPF